VVVVIAGLYFGRQVLIPFAFAVVLAFLFTPLVSWLQRLHLGRVPAVLLVLVLSFSALGSVGWVVTGQLMDIVDQFPSYRSNIDKKVLALRNARTNHLRTATNTVTELNAELSAASQAAIEKPPLSARSRPVPVQVAQPPSSAPQYLRAVLGPLAGVMETGGMVIVFTLFMLIKREDLRNRVIRLAGTGQINVMTRALDDASRRLSRYLFLQFVMNGCYGILFGTLVYIIGVPHALLCGVLGGLLRFIPYVGTPIATFVSVAIALAVLPGWHQAALVVASFIILELILVNIVEPWLYGAHTGISSLAILVAAVFWAMLWGPVGLILSTPLTVCLILLGRYVPHLSFLDVLLGDEAVLPAEAQYYQRLLAFDDEEAHDIAESYLKNNAIGSFYDSILIPALALSERDRHVNSLEERSAKFVTSSTRELVEELGDRLPATQSSEPVMLFNADPIGPGHSIDRIASSPRIVCLAAVDEADEIVALMVQQLLQQLGCTVQLLQSDHKTIIHDATIHSAQFVIVSAMPPFAAGPARLLCKSLRARRPDLKIVLGLWGFEGGVEKAKERLGPGCADLVATNLQQVISYVAESLQPTHAQPEMAEQ